MLSSVCNKRFLRYEAALTMSGPHLRVVLCVPSFYSVCAPCILLQFCGPQNLVARITSPSAADTPREDPLVLPFAFANVDDDSQETECEMKIVLFYHPCENGSRTLSGRTVSLKNRHSYAKGSRAGKLFRFARILLLRPTQASKKSGLINLGSSESSIVRTTHCKNTSGWRVVCPVGKDTA